MHREIQIVVPEAVRVVLEFKVLSQVLQLIMPAEVEVVDIVIILLLVPAAMVVVVMAAVAVQILQVQLQVLRIQVAEGAAQVKLVDLFQVLVQEVVLEL
jgi:hypothetical protein